MAMKKDGIGSLIDELIKAEDRLAAAKAKLHPLEEQVGQFRAELLQALGEAGLESARGAKGGAARVHRVVYTATDWDAVHRWALKYRRLDIFQRRIVQSTAAEMAEAGKPVPGVEANREISLRITRGSK